MSSASSSISPSPTVDDGFDEDDDPRPKTTQVTDKGSDTPSRKRNCDLDKKADQ